MDRQSAKKPAEPRQLLGRLKRVLRAISDSAGLAFMVLAVVLVALSTWAAFSIVVTSGWKSDAAAWVQAAGSIAAIVGAIWLAQNQARRARRVRREQYGEAAWYVRFAITQAQFESQVIAAELVNRTTRVEESDVRKWRQQATTSAIGLTALASRTDHVHPAVTQVISNAKVLVDDLVCDLAALATLVEEDKLPRQELIGWIVSPHTALLELVNQYDERMRGIQIALDDGDDALPIKILAHWNPDHTGDHR